MKTKVKIVEDTHRCNLKKGDIGYIDGYVTVAKGVIHAVVVCDGVIDKLPLDELKATGFLLESQMGVV